MRKHLVPLAAVAALVPAFADAPPVAALVAAPATAVVRPVAAGQRLIRLPALDYTITVEADCGAVLEAQAASLSIADTSVSLNAQALATSPVTVQLRVPREQVAPVAVDGFCQAGEPAPGESPQTRVSDAVTAHLSLRCSSDERQAMIYASKPLGVTIECERIQAPSAPSPAR